MAVPQTLPTLNALWRPNETGPEPRTYDDVDGCREACGLTGAYHDLQRLVEAMNRLAQYSPAAVERVQLALNEIDELETQWSGKVALGTAVLGAADEYEGPIPGLEITDAVKEKKLGPIEQDTDLYKVKLKRGSGGGQAGGTEQQIIEDRIGALQARIVRALGLSTGQQAYSAALIRS